MNGNQFMGLRLRFDGGGCMNENAIHGALKKWVENGELQ